MRKNEFKSLFLRVLEEASQEVEIKMGIQISRNFEIRLYGAGSSNLPLDIDAALNLLYISEEQFYRIIDVSIIAIGKDKTQVFVRTSDHKPSSFEKTWNTPHGYGPFKQLIAKDIKLIN